MGTEWKGSSWRGNVRSQCWCNFKLLFESSAQGHSVQRANLGLSDGIPASLVSRSAGL